jgi:hypothetical protein
VLHGSAIGRSCPFPVLSDDRFIDRTTKAGHALPDGNRERVKILSLVLHHDEQGVSCAMDKALEQEKAQEKTGKIA